MTLDSHDESEVKQLAKLLGRPKDTLRAGEKTKWQRIKKILWPYLRKGGEWAIYGEDLAKDYAASEIAKRKAEAEERLSKAAEHAAKAKETRLQSVTLANAELERIAKSDAPESIKAAQLACILAEFPEIKGQLEVIKSIIVELRETYGFSIAMERSNELPDDEDESGNSEP